MDIFVRWIVAAITMLVLDAIWLSTMVNTFYRKHLGSILADKANFIAASIFYLMYTTLVVFLVINPAIKNNNSLGKVFATGALTGLLAYGTYDLTNQAVTKNWSWTITVVDMIWGTLLTGIVCLITVKLVR